MVRGNFYFRAKRFYESQCLMVKFPFILWSRTTSDVRGNTINFYSPQGIFFANVFCCKSEPRPYFLLVNSTSNPCALVTKKS